MKVGEQIKYARNTKKEELETWVNKFNRDFWEKEKAEKSKGVLN